MFNNNISYLFHLIWLSLIPVSLKINFLRYSFFPENVVTAFDTHLKSKIFEHAA